LPAGKSLAEVAKLAGARLIRTTAMRRCCSGVIGTCTRAARLAQLLPRQSHSSAWSRWWHKTVLAKTKVNPGWPPCAPPLTHDRPTPLRFCSVVVPYFQNQQTIYHHNIY
jgi:hypothetical protein